MRILDTNNIDQLNGKILYFKFYKMFFILEFSKIMNEYTKNYNLKAEVYLKDGNNFLYIKTNQFIRHRKSKEPQMLCGLIFYMIENNSMRELEEYKLAIFHLSKLHAEKMINNSEYWQEKIKIINRRSFREKKIVV